MKTRLARSRIGYSFGHPLVKAGGVACVVAAAALAAALLVWWPAHRSDIDLAAKVAAERRALVEARQAGELARVYARNQHAVPQLERKLASAVDQTQIVDALGRLARTHGVRIVDQGYAERRGQASGGLVIELAVEGAYGSVRNFVHGLAALPVWIELHEMQLDRSGEAGNVKARLRLVSFRGKAA